MLQDLKYVKICRLKTHKKEKKCKNVCTRKKKEAKMKKYWEKMDRKKKTHLKCCKI